MMKARFDRLDPPARRVVIVALAVGLLIVAGVVGALFARPEPVDLRWATYDDVIVGTLAPDIDGAVSRLVDPNGTPVANSDNTVDLTFSRCGPVADVSAVSSRTWVLTLSDNTFVGFEGQQLSIDLQATSGCKTFELPYAVPVAVAAAAGDRGALLELRFELRPVDPALGAIVITSEPFRLWQPGLDLETELVIIDQEEGYSP